MTGATYDTGALVAAERNDRRMWSLHVGYIDEGSVPVVPAPVLAQVWRGGARQARLSQFLAGCDIEPMTETQARQVGVIVGLTADADVVDATVVEGAIRRDDVVVTSDARDLRRIAAAMNADLTFEVI